ncbi:superoxide dismutase [Desmospora activa]|uniref:superoxide dismutase n=1 Tax=Desmospora activa DSM 45169 TaxID=1121389 RepID=A0A2T4Z9K6_9BACL|nr:superoxide dismutase [Desmospora activa]PTM58555.1 Fe-Mn family superoxide dismutase [Desmospora activa DSM 45169]
MEYWNSHTDRLRSLRNELITFSRTARRTLHTLLTKENPEATAFLDKLKQLEEQVSSSHPRHLYGLRKEARRIWKEIPQLQDQVQPAALSSEGEQSEEKSEATTENHSIPLNPVPIGKHTLPPLPYPYDALEPYIDTKTMHLHHDEHHKSYVDGLNKAEKMMAKARQTGDFDLIKHWEREASFNGAGHYLHTLFWEIMSPNGGGKPTGKLAQQIQQDFGSLDAFKKHFSSAANKVEGGGWALLIWSPRSHRLEILQAEKHNNLSQQDQVPLLALDVWEHAYYLKYPNKRKEYIKAWWHVVNWPAVDQRFREARHLLWKPS